MKTEYVVLLVFAFCLSSISHAEVFPSHPPMRPLPESSTRPQIEGPSRYVDRNNGDDAADGGEATPWKTLRHSLRQLQPGDTLHLRGGVYYEKAFLTQSGSPGKPITIRSHPGELAIIDGGLREFYEEPAASWKPLPASAGGVEGEFVSTRTYFDVDARRVPQQFLPAAWEPMWGIEQERPLVVGHFADSMVPLHGYRLLVDLRSKNERWIGNKHAMRDTGIYCGPGLWFNRKTGRIHVRLAHHQLEGLGERAYRGATDPRKVPLVVAAGFGEEVLRIMGVQHVRIQDVVFRGATGSPMIHVYGSDDIELDHITVFGGFPALLVNASKNLRVRHSAFRGLAAPWSSRAHMKYRGVPSYQIVFKDNQPRNENVEFSHCEFTDDHDFAFLRFATNLQFHHNFVDNFNDDGLECGPKLRDHTIFIYQNRIGRCLIPLTQHEIAKDEAPLDHDADSGVFVYRNVFDMRGGTYSAPPREPDPSGSFLAREGHLVGDHGSPIWPVMHVYHNTFLRESPVFRDYYLFGLGAQGLRHTERHVFNNIFVQMDRVPGVGFVGMKEAARVREGGNLIWGVAQGPTADDPFAKFRSSALFADSRKPYAAGWTTHDKFADPLFTELKSGWTEVSDLRLRPDSPAIDAGVRVPVIDWHDPLRLDDAAEPDLGALPVNTEPWGVGIDGRMSLF